MVLMIIIVMNLMITYQIPTALRILESVLHKVFKILCLTELISCVSKKSFQTRKKCKVSITTAKNIPF